MVRTRAVEALPGWRRLDAYHSPGDTNRFVRKLEGGWFEVVDVGSYGSPGTWFVERSIERGVLEKGRGGERPYVDTEVRTHSALAENADKQKALDVARRAMGGRKSADPEFDFGGML
jgi:hypothetical protein